MSIAAVNREGGEAGERQADREQQEQQGERGGERAAPADSALRSC